MVCDEVSRSADKDSGTASVEPPVPDVVPVEPAGSVAPVIGLTTVAPEGFVPVPVPAGSALCAVEVPFGELPLPGADRNCFHMHRL